MYSNGDDLIAQLNRLLEKLHQTDGNKQGSTVINIYEKGSLHVDHVENQHFYGDKWTKALQGKEPMECLPSTELSFDDNTPLSALFQKNHHKELSSMIDSWRPYLIGDDPTVDALDMTSFRFDFKKTIATSIYIDIGRLLHDHALIDDNMNKLAWYLFYHSNLSKSQATLHAQLRKYKKR